MRSPPTGYGWDARLSDQDGGQPEVENPSTPGKAGPACNTPTFAESCPAQLTSTLELNTHEDAEAEKLVIATPAQEGAACGEAVRPSEAL